VVDSPKRFMGEWNSSGLVGRESVVWAFLEGRLLGVVSCVALAGVRAACFFFIVVF
jgi:hypothetical protein